MSTSHTSLTSIQHVLITSFQMAQPEHFMGQVIVEEIEGHEHYMQTIDKIKTLVKSRSATLQKKYTTYYYHLQPSILMDINRSQRSSTQTTNHKYFYLILSKKDQDFPKAYSIQENHLKNRQKYAYQMRDAALLNYQRYFNLKPSQMQNESNVLLPKFTHPQQYKWVSTSQEDNNFLINNQQFAKGYPQYQQIMQMSRDNLMGRDIIFSIYQFINPLKIPLPLQYFRSETSFQDQSFINQEVFERDYHQYWQMMQRSRHNLIRDGIFQIHLDTGIIMEYHNHQAAQLRIAYQQRAQRFS